MCKEEIKDGAIKCKHCGSMLADIETVKTLHDSKTAKTPNVERTTVGASQTDYGLKKMNVSLLVFLTIVTLGVYMPIWFLSQKAGLNAFNTKEKVGSGFFAGIFVFSIIIFSIAGIANIVSIFTDVQTPKTVYMELICQIALIIQAFKIKSILNEHFNEHLKKDVSFSGAHTFFLTIFYLQYKINKL